MTDDRRVQSSAALSAAFHALALGAYFMMKAGEQAQLVLTNVEFIDLRPPAPATPEAPPGALEQAPRGVRDFLRMALPSFKSAEPQEAPREARVLPEALSQPQIKLDSSRTLARAERPALARPADPRASSFSDLAARTDERPATSAELAPAEAKPSISLEEVGRRAAREAGSPAIRIDPNARGPARSGLAEVALAPARPSAASSGAPLEAAISLQEGGPRRAGGGGVPSAPLGYGRGGGGGISLDGKPGARGGGSEMADPKDLAPKAADSPAPKLDLSNKGVEISGPLAQRKVLSHSLPSYPDWARAKGIEAEVVIRFFVSAEGRVRDRLILERTSGHPELDRLSMEAIKRWTFVPLAGAEEDQWGIITFRFRLR